MIIHRMGCLSQQLTLKESAVSGDFRQLCVTLCARCVCTLCVTLWGLLALLWEALNGHKSVRVPDIDIVEYSMQVITRDDMRSSSCNNNVRRSASRLNLQKSPTLVWESFPLIPSRVYISYKVTNIWKHKCSRNLNCSKNFLPGFLSRDAFWVLNLHCVSEV